MVLTLQGLHIYRVTFSEWHAGATEKVPYDTLLGRLSRPIVAPLKLISIQETGLGVSIFNE